MKVNVGFAALATGLLAVGAEECRVNTYKLPSGDSLQLPVATSADLTGACSERGELKLNGANGQLTYCDTTWKTVGCDESRITALEEELAGISAAPVAIADAVPSGSCAAGTMSFDTTTKSLHVCAAGGWVHVQGKNPACLGAATLLTAGLPASAATASSIYGGQSPGNAIDGITTIHNQFHSNNEANSWWRVDLGVEATVDYIDFVNNYFNCGGSTGCGFRSVGAVIYVSSTTSAPWSGGSGVQCGAPYASSDLASDATPHRFDCPDDTVGRYVWWYRASTEYTNFVELSPYGWPAADC